MENPQKVQSKLRQLNAGLAQPQWTAGPGFHALTTFSFGTGANPPTFNPSQGLPVKVFFNTSTGEYRLFTGTLFTD
jgi:hypothetical protein